MLPANYWKPPDEVPVVVLEELVEVAPLPDVPVPVGNPETTSGGWYTA